MSAGEAAPRDSSLLDFVRSLAVLAVLADHVLETTGALRGFDPTPLAWYLGRMGVLLFFVLTSLVLLRSLERSARRGDPGAAAFFVLEPWLLALSVGGAVVLNLVLAVNHKPGRYNGY